MKVTRVLSNTDVNVPPELHATEGRGRRYRDVFAWLPVRLCHPAYLCPNGRWAWLRRVRRIPRRYRSAAFIEIPEA